LTALRTAAGRGVDVRLILPSLSDVRLVMWASRSFYRPLISSGVRIFEYGAGRVHAKALIKDSEVFCVGSANVDNRSFRLNFEISWFVADEVLTTELAEWLEQLFAVSDEVTAETLDRRRLSHQLLESAAHLMSPLL
jgi:cardiolipin synthase